MSNLQMQGLSNYPVSFLEFINNINVCNYLKFNIIVHFQQALFKLPAAFPPALSVPVPRLPFLILAPF